MSSNNSNSVRDATTFDFETIKYGQPKVNNLGGKNVKILDPLTNQWLMISTPLMLSFGIGDYVDPQTGVGNGKYEISLLFPNKDYSKEGREKNIQKAFDIAKKSITCRWIYFNFNYYLSYLFIFKEIF